MSIGYRLGEMGLWLERRYLLPLLNRRSFRILFSKKDDWEPMIRRDFRYSRHRLTFDLITEENIRKNDLIVPIAIDDILYLNRVRYLIDENPIPIPNAESVRLCDNKFLFNRFLTENNFDQLIPRMGRKPDYPYILKKKIDGWGMNSHIICGEEEEEKHQGEIDSEDYFCQEIVRGKSEYAAHLIFSKGAMVHHLNIEYVYDDDIYIKGKNKWLYVRETDCPYVDIFCSVLKRIGFEGLCCINYKTSNHLPLILEINPRFGGSLSNHFFSFMRYIA